MMPTRPASVRSRTHGIRSPAGSKDDAGMSLTATASTRSARPAMASFSAWKRARAVESSACVPSAPSQPVDSSRSTSGAPLTQSRTNSPSWWKVAMNLLRRVERNLGDARGPPGQRLRLEPTLGGKREQSAFSGVADQLVVTDAAVVGERSSSQQRFEIDTRVAVFGRDRTAGGIALARHRKPLSPAVHGARRHLVERERAGLVRADHRGAAEGLDGRELLHDRAIARHATHAQRQRDGNDRRQSLGDRRDRERDGGEQDLDQGLCARKAQQEDRADERARDPRKTLAERIELALQWRGPRFRLVEQSGHAPHFRGHARGRDQRFDPSARDHRVHEDHVAALAERRIHRDDCLGDLGHRVRLAGEGRLGDLGVVGREHASIGGHTVAGFEQHQVARHQLRGADLLHAAVAAHARHRRKHLLQRGERRFGPVFLPEAEHGVEQHHRQDHHRILDIAYGAGQHCRRDQHDDQDTPELVRERQPPGTRRLLGQAVLPVTLQARARLARGQPVGRVDSEPRHRRFRVERMAVGACWFGRGRGRCHVFVRGHLAERHPAARHTTLRRGEPRRNPAQTAGYHRNPPAPGSWRDRRRARVDRGGQYARFLVSIIRRISGVRMICIASGSLPPGTTSVFGRDMNESWIIDSR